MIWCIMFVPRNDQYRNMNTKFNQWLQLCKSINHQEPYSGIKLYNSLSINIGKYES